MRKSCFTLIMIMSIFFVPFTFVQKTFCEEMPLKNQLREERRNVDFEINSDGSINATIEVAIAPQSNSAVKKVRQTIIPIPYREGASEVEILEAYTHKKSGERLAVHKDKITTQQLKDNPLYNDMKIKALIFPEVDIGDLVVYRARVQIGEPKPGHFNVLYVFPQSKDNSLVRIRMKQHKESGLNRHEHEVLIKDNMLASNKHLPERIGDFYYQEWKYRNRNAVTLKRNDADRDDSYPRLIIATFRQHQRESGMTVKLRDDVADKWFNTTSDEEKAIHDYLLRNMLFVFLNSQEKSKHFKGIEFP